MTSPPTWRPVAAEDLRPSLEAAAALIRELAALGDLPLSAADTAELGAVAGRAADTARRLTAIAARAAPTPPAPEGEEEEAAGFVVLRGGRCRGAGRTPTEAIARARGSGWETEDFDPMSSDGWEVRPIARSGLEQLRATVPARLLGIDPASGPAWWRL